MVPLGEKQLEVSVTCFSEGSLKSETLMLGMHFVMSM